MMTSPLKYKRIFLLIVYCLLLHSYGVLANTYWGWIGETENANFKAGFCKKGMSAFHVASDTVNLIADDGAWGNVIVRYRIDNEDWITLMTEFTRVSRIDEHTFLYTDSLIAMPLCMQRHFSLKEDGMHLRIEISTTGKQAVELGDIVLPVQWRPHGGEGASAESIFERGFIQKHNISLNSSYLTFSKPSGAGPFYLMMANDNTPLEYFDTSGRQYNAYIHSACTGPETEGTWRMAHTAQVLQPAGQKGDKVVYEFTMTSAPRYEDIRETVYQHGLLDIRIAPGYTLPRELKARMAIRFKGEIQSIEPEFPDQTQIVALGKGPNGSLLYDVQFNRLGENLLTVHYNNGEKTVMEFFSTEPVETLIKKRSAFIVNKQQHKVPGKWWDGLYSVYDMKYGKLRGPEDTDGFDGWYGYVLACDDPILGKAPYVAAKNVIYPDSSEIASLEYHIENYVWGKLQRTDKEEPYPYAIYGVPNWPIARDSALHAMNNHVHNDLIKIWCAYDYPHIFKMYYHMYQIASNFPQWTHYSDGDGYFERAVQTAKAFFTYPYEVLTWLDIYKWGMYNEWLVPDLIAELEKRGRTEDAGFLRSEWEKKAKYFIYDDKYPYRSEYSFDRTAFESSYALAKYAIENPMKPDENLWYDKNKKVWYSHPNVSVEEARRFMDQQHYAGLSVRGWHAPKFYLAGADCPGFPYARYVLYGYDGRMVRTGIWIVVLRQYRLD
jgi:hypothetical protein